MAEEDLTKNASGQAGGQPAASQPAPPGQWQAPPGQWQAPPGQWQAPPGQWQPASPWQAPYPAPGWPGQSSPWGAAAPYLSTGWGYQPAFWPVAYPPPGPVPGVRWAGVGVRFGALVIDFIILVAAFFALSVGLAAIGSNAERDPQVVTALVIVWWLLVLMYHPACWYVFGASAGQKALGLRVARASDGQALGIGGVLARFLIFATVTVLIPLGIISAFMASQDPYQRAWHDLVARSVVVGRG
jgi:uncharacterized RDD family membrane protein YckC